ncbi:MAG TPA: glycosyltransferase family 4 protein [Candidatus Methylomirabilis sp.]|nr:glycosyltransferase family 4 protein [Candidatus Methylomirabilis sp.]
MRILVLSDHFPPHFVGGYEIICEDVVDGLRERGHEVAVLTSTFGVDRPTTEGHVQRRLHYCDSNGNPPPTSLLGRAWIERRERAILAEAIRAFRPQLLFVWHMWYLLRSLLQTAERWGVPMVYYFSDYWLENYYTVAADRWFTFWSRTPQKRYKRALKPILFDPMRRLCDIAVPTVLRPLRLDRAIFSSRALRDAYAARGFPLASPAVIYPGVSTARFAPRADAAVERPRSLLYVGRLVEEKGVHTLLHALRRLVHQYGHTGLRLTLLGDAAAQRPAYLEQLTRLVAGAGLQSEVRFAGKVVPAQVVGAYHTHDIFVLPSLWDEPFSRTLLEAMASGMTVVATATGGSGEILRHGENSLVFRAGDDQALAGCIDRLIGDPQLCRGLAASAAETVRRTFNLRQMIDRIEQHLAALIGERGEAA